MGRPRGGVRGRHLASGAVFCGLGVWMLLPALRKAPDAPPREREATPRLLRMLREPQPGAGSLLLVAFGVFQRR